MGLLFKIKQATTACHYSLSTVHWEANSHEELLVFHRFTASFRNSQMVLLSVSLQLLWSELTHHYLFYSSNKDIAWLTFMSLAARSLGLFWGLNNKVSLITLYKSMQPTEGCHCRQRNWTLCSHGYVFQGKLFFLSSVLQMYYIQ